MCYKKYFREIMWHKLWGCIFLHDKLFSYWILVVVTPKTLTFLKASTGFWYFTKCCRSCKWERKERGTGVLRGSQAYHCANNHVYQPLGNSSSGKNCKNEYDIFLWLFMEMYSIKGETIKEHYLYFLYFCFLNIRKLSCLKYSRLHFSTAIHELVMQQLYLPH